VRASLRGRFWIAVVLTIASGALLVLTIVEPAWIERVFAIEPDQGSGSLEVTIALAAFAVAMIAVSAAVWEWARVAGHRASESG
jgi:hypothetical protein